MNRAKKLKLQEVSIQYEQTPIIFNFIVDLLNIQLAD